MKRLPILWVLSLTWVLFAPTLSAAAPSLSKLAYTTIQKAQESLAKGDTGQAVTTLKQLVDASAGRPYTQAVAMQSLAHAEIARDRPAAAIPLLKRSLALEVLPYDAQQRTRYNLAQLYMATEKFSDAVAQLNIWFADTKQAKAEAYALLGSAHLQLRQFRSAVKPLRQAIKRSNKPRESWYQGLLGAYSELKEYAQCVKLLRTMIKVFPERASYWRQLAGIELLRQRYADALAVMHLAYLRGHLEAERDLLNLAQLYAQRDAPYKAAQLIEKEIATGRIRSRRKHWEQAANAWYQARETKRSIRALEKAIKHGGANSRLGLRLANLYLEAENWQLAEARLLGVVKAPLDDAERGRAWLLLGIARHNGNALEQAKSAFAKASQFKASQKDANQWLTYLQSLDVSS